MAFDLSFGLFVVAAIALHNIPEATLLASVYRAIGVGLGRAAGLAVVSDVGLVFVAVTTFAVLDAAPAALPWGLGFASGALIYLVTVDLLPESYRQAGPTTIGLVTVLAMGLTIGAQGWFR